MYHDISIALRIHTSTDHQTLVANLHFGLKERNAAGGTNVFKSCCKVDDHYNQFSRNADGKCILRFMPNVDDIELMELPKPI